MPINPPDDAALIVIDVQYSFLPQGSLAVPNGDEVIAVVNGIARTFRNVILTQDWHPPGHVSFASSHPGRKPFDKIMLGYGSQMLWPDHCVQATHGAAIHEDIEIPHAQLIIRKGFNPRIDSYSAFIEADGTRTGLDGYLHARGITAVYLVGLATDFCIAWSAVDAVKLGFSARVIEDGCRAIDVDGSLAAAWKTMSAAGVERS